ncbi:MAG: Rne/Rng family ribonuclease [Acidobacteriota bacterium]
MTRRMLINAQDRAELRVALANDKVLDDYKVDVAERGLTRGNIYFGYIANIQPSLNAAFIDYGAERHGFLAIQDVVPDAYYKEAQGKRPKIEDVLEKGRPIVVQVTREPEGSKGAALTTNLSLAGRYLVLMPFDRTRGISRKVQSDDQRDELLDLVDSLDIPDDCGVIVRTNALGQNKTALNRDLRALLRLWKRIGTEARSSKQTKLLYSDQDIVLQALRDFLDNEVEEVLVDDDAAFEKAQEYMKAFMPRSKTTLTRYSGRAPIFSTLNLEPQIEGIYERSVKLPSGGSIVIDPTEALVAIDVNSGRATQASSQEETAVKTNVEAAAEVARQLRLRDIGGLIVVDFIDMRSRRNQRKVEKQLRDSMKVDRARFSLGKISANGLLEINRQRLHQAIQLRTHRSCPTCSGTGRVASPEIVALHLLREIEARAAAGFMKGVSVGLHPELADFIQNQRRREIMRLVDEFDIDIEIVASPKLERPEKDISWFAKDRAEIQRLEKEKAEERKVEEEARAAASIGFHDEEIEVVEPADEEDDEGTRRKRSRRRRGGRRRKKRKADGEETQEKRAAQEEAPRRLRRRRTRRGIRRRPRRGAPQAASPSSAPTSPRRW